MFGVPTAVISIVCYALCCMEPFDEEEFYDSTKRSILKERAEAGKGIVVLYNLDCSFIFFFFVCFN